MPGTIVLLEVQQIDEAIGFPPVRCG